MKRNIFRLMTLCTVAVLALASCKKDNKPQANVPEDGFLATVEASQGNGGRTHLVGSEVQWNAGDQIVVRNGNGTSATFSLSSGENTTEGTFRSESGDDFFQPSYKAVYPATGNTVTGEGTANITLPATQSYVANSFANGAMPMMAVSGEQTLAFKNMLGGICFPMTGSQTVTRLVLTSNTATDNLSGVFAADYNNGQPTLTYTSGGANSITLDCGTGVTLTSTATDFTIMVPAGTLANGFKLEAYNGEEKIFEKTNDATLGADFIARSVIKKVNSNLEVGEAQFAGLTFEAKTAGSTVTFIGRDYGDEYNPYQPAPTLEYSTDGETWNSYTSGTAITLANIGDKVMFRGDNERLGVIEISTDAETGDQFIFYQQNSYFSCTGECYVYGNVMSLLDKENFATVTSVPTAAFVGLFNVYDNRSIFNHPQHPIELPATTLGNGCYQKMFYDCRNLTTAPVLPATTLADRCYLGMFEDCTSLTTAPELPATTLADGCYYDMFRGCTNLTTAPELPVTTLAGSCYSGMFGGCTSLTTAPVLPATTLAYACYIGMFVGCTSLTTAPVLPATTLADRCYERMFEDCTSLTTAPVLPATTLTTLCYDQMFWGCTNLNYIKCLATDISAYGYVCTSWWVREVSSTGTFVKHPSMTGWGTGWDGIPSGWTVVDAEL